MELDLHGYTVSDALAEFIKVYNESLGGTDGRRASTLTVVHGYGSTGEGGAIRDRLRAFLQRHSSRLEFKNGEDYDGNQGCTLVTPIKPLPDSFDELAEQIWDYCKSAKPRSRISQKFRRYGDPRIKQAMNKLERQGRLLKRGQGRFESQ